MLSIGALPQPGDLAPNLLNKNDFAKHARCAVAVR